MKCSAFLKQGAYQGQSMCKKLWRLSKRIKKMENGLVVLGSFLAKTKGRAIAEKFYDEIIRLKKVCIYMDVIVETEATVFVMRL